MKKIIHIAVFFILFFCLNVNAFGQETKSVDADYQLKETLYKKYKKEVQLYDKKDFDALFFDFFKIENDKDVLLTKEQFYTYTIKIALYSEKLGLLYKNQKEESQKAKQEWFDRKYTDYLITKK